MNNVKTIISSVITVIAIIVLGISLYNLNNLSNFSPQDDPEYQRIQSELNDSMIRLIDICTTTNHLGTLMSCKSETIPNFIDMCNSEENSNLPICSDVKSKEFFSNIDERIEILSKDYDTLRSRVDLAQYKVIETCYVKNTNLDLCKNEMLEIKSRCVQYDEVRDLSSCNDPRIEEIINRVPSQSDNYIDIVNDQVMDLLESCSEVTTEACVNGAKQIMMACGIESTVQACFDPRLEEIANYDVQSILDPEIINPESTYEQIPTSTMSTLEKRNALNADPNTFSGTCSIGLNGNPHAKGKFTNGNFVIGTIFADAVLLDSQGNVLGIIPIDLYDLSPNEERYFDKFTILSDGNWKTCKFQIRSLYE